MNSSITVRNIDPSDKSWLRREARQRGLSMEELVRRLIHEERMRVDHRLKPSDAFELYFGAKHGVELPPPPRACFKPMSFSGESEQ